MTRTTTSGAENVQASIDRLAEALNQFRVESAADRGSTVTELRHIQESIRELNGLFGKVASLETRMAVAESSARDLDKQVRDWHEESAGDRAHLHAADDRQDRLIYTGAGILSAVQLALTLFGPSIRAGLRLP